MPVCQEKIGHNIWSLSKAVWHKGLSMVGKIGDRIFFNETYIQIFVTTIFALNARKAEM